MEFNIFPYWFLLDHRPQKIAGTRASRKPNLSWNRTHMKTHRWPIIRNIFVKVDSQKQGHLGTPTIQIWYAVSTVPRRMVVTIFQPPRRHHWAHHNSKRIKPLRSEIKDFNQRGCQDRSRNLGWPTKSHFFKSDLFNLEGWPSPISKMSLRFFVFKKAHFPKSARC